ncbi:MAG: hypothetical protein ACM3SS_19660 [Rhodospirillaceae bacterium]
MHDWSTVLCTSSDLNAIVAENGLPLSFADVVVAASELNDLLHQFLSAHRWEQLPPPSKSRDQLRDIKIKAKKLALELPPVCDPHFSCMDIAADTFRRLASAAEIIGASRGGYKGLPPFTTTTGGTWYRGRERLMAAIESISLLVEWSEEAEKRVSHRVRAVNKKNRGDAALNALFGDILGFWIEHAEEASIPTVWASDTGPTSPIIKMILALRDLVRRHLSPEHMAEDVQLAKTLSKITAQSAKDRLERITKPLKAAARRQ